MRLKCAVDQSIGKSDLELILGCQVIQYVCLCSDSFYASFRVKIDTSDLYAAISRGKRDGYVFCCRMDRFADT